MSNAHQTFESHYERILSVADELYYRDGIHRTSLRKIANVTGVTTHILARNFPTRDALIFAYLNGRHERWMNRFAEYLNANAMQYQERNYVYNPLITVLHAIKTLVVEPNFRGCAFNNAVIEIGNEIPQIIQIAHNHKIAMQTEIFNFLPRRIAADCSRAAYLTVEGAIIQAGLGKTPTEDIFNGMGDTFNALWDCKNV